MSALTSFRNWTLDVGLLSEPIPAGLPIDKPMWRLALDRREMVDRRTTVVLIFLVTIMDVRLAK